MNQNYVFFFISTPTTGGGGGGDNILITFFLSKIKILSEIFDGKKLLKMAVTFDPPPIFFFCLSEHFAPPAILTTRVHLSYLE